MIVYFSASTLGFFPMAWLKDGTYKEDMQSNDLVELSSDELLAFWKKSPPEGKILSANKMGRPCWVDINPATEVEIIKRAASQKERLLESAEKIITKLERAKKHGVATDSELDQLSSWEIYSILLMRINPDHGSKINWPNKPTA